MAEVTKKAQKRAKRDKSKCKKSAIDNKKNKFESVKSLRAALNLVARSRFHHSMYQHYTTFENVLNKISKGEWWLSCCTSDRLNDQKETVKFGDYKMARRMYQTCFCHGAAESVAMWGLYQCSKPCAIRLTFPVRTMQKWLKDLKESRERKFKHVLFRDIVYVAVAETKLAKDRYEIRRRNCASWESAVAQLSGGLVDDIHESWATGLIKDYEWRHERESRLLVEVLKHEEDGLKINIPDYVLEDIRFTFSPWMSPNLEPIVEGLIMQALKNKLGRNPKQLEQRFRRSVLTGGLRLGDGRVPCASCGSCFLFGGHDKWCSGV